MFFRATIPKAGPMLFASPVFQYACQGAKVPFGAWPVKCMTCACLCLIQRHITHHVLCPKNKGQAHKL